MTHSHGKIEYNCRYFIMTFRTQIHKKKFGKKCFRTLQGTMSHRPLTNTSSLKIAAAYCPLIWSVRVHCNFTGDGKCNKRGWACTPHPHQPRQILPSWLNVRQKAYVTSLCTLWSQVRGYSIQYTLQCKHITSSLCKLLQIHLQFLIIIRIRLRSGSTMKI